MASTTQTQKPAETEAETKAPVSEQAITMMRERVEALAPLRAEHDRLTTYLSAIDAAMNGTPAQAEPSPAPAQRRQSRTRASNGSNEPSGRAAEFLSVIRENPGITVAEAAKQMKGIKQANYLYRLKSQLQEAGKIRPEGRGMVAV